MMRLDGVDQLFHPCRIGLARWQLLHDREPTALGGDGRAGLGIYSRLLVVLV
jgi:hypothetical protein